MLVDLEIMTTLLFLLFVGVVSFDCFNAHSRDCYEVANQTVCYFQPNDTYMEMTWDDAWTVCKENNSTLPVVENRLIEETLRSHLESKSFLSREIWLAGREIRTNVWQWLNGKHFGRQDLFRNRDHSRSPYHTNAVITGQLQYMLSYGRDPNNYICHYNDSKPCQNVSVINWKNGCLFVNNDKQLNIVDARNRCLDEGGDLATFEEDEDLRSLPKDSSLFIKDRQYWIGLRLNWWIWNETDSSKEIKSSNWAYYENRLNEECVRLIDNKWNQSSCTIEKPFICQTGTRDLFSHSNGTSSQGTPLSPLIDLQTGIIIGAIALVVVVIVTVVLVMILKRTRNKRISHPPDEKPTVPHEISTQPIENKSVKTKSIEVDEEMSNHYAEITRVNHDNRDECRDEPQPAILYATLEFEGNKAIYEEPVISSQRKQEASAPTNVGALNGNGQHGSNSAESSTQVAEGTIYANM